MHTFMHGKKNKISLKTTSEASEETYKAKRNIQTGRTEREIQILPENNQAMSECCELVWV